MKENQNDKDIQEINIETNDNKQDIYNSKNSNNNQDNDDDNDADGSNSDVENLDFSNAKKNKEK